MKTVKEWFEEAQRNSYAIGAFNADNLEIFKAILTAARTKKSPVIIEFSPGEVGYFGLVNIIDLVDNAKKEYEVPVFLNLDHAIKIEDCFAAIAQTGPPPDGGWVGFDEIHFDGSWLEYRDNVKNTKGVVEAAHKKGLLVEGEVNKFLGSSEVHLEDIDPEVLKQSFTDPAVAANFVAETHIDIFAPSFGSVHGTYPVQPDLDLGLLARIHETLPATFLSLHGGSGIPSDQVKEAIRVGKIVKVNVNTELRQAYKDALTEKLGDKPDESKVYSLAPDIILAVVAVVEAKIEVFGSAGKA